MRDRQLWTDERCAACNDEWLQGRLVCRDCRQPLRIRHRDLAAQVAAFAAEDEALGTGPPVWTELFASWLTLAGRLLHRRVAPAMTGSD